MSTDQILNKGFLLLVIGVLTLSACQPQTVASTSIPAEKTPAQTSTSLPTATITPTTEPTQVPSTATITKEVVWICSPLEDETIETLPLIIVNPLVIPPIGRDDGHHGVDFAYYRRGDRESIQGIEVYAIIKGRVVLTMADNTPYGYVILIETPLSDLPKDLQEELATLYQPLPDNVQYQGECPQFNLPEFVDELSIYTLYAHQEEKPNYLAGESIPCGSLLGTVGNTGRSSNPHLHLETRLGPANAEIGDMAFYETRYTEEQRANYCLWRMSGYFQLFDPFILFEHGS
jgi:hypothetical protein